MSAPQKRARAAASSSVGGGGGDDADMPNDRGAPKKQGRKTKVEDCVHENCEICSAPAKPDGSNWKHIAIDARGRNCPGGPICLKCGDFVDDSPFTVSELVAQAPERLKYRKQIKMQITTHKNITSNDMTSFSKFKSLLQSMCFSFYNYSVVIHIHI